MSAKLPMSIETLQVRRIKKLEARIAQLEAGLNRIKGLADAPDPDPMADIQFGLHAGLEDRGAQGNPYDACDYGFSEGASRVMEWAVNEAEAALKETP